MIGKTVGSYKIIAELGEGGMGAVYLAEHTLMGKQAAVKVLLPQFCAVKEIVERFFNEAKSASMIKHPGIVDIYDFGNQEDGSAFIVMELLEGEELTELLAREPRLHGERVALFGQQIASALEAAHELGIVHRDLKPDNIFLEPDSAAKGGVRPKILDFGIAKLGDDLSGSSVKTRTGAVMGTPVFMSPEQCTGAGAVDHRSDIYSLGCILYQMIAGRPPFVKNGAGALIAAHITEAPQPVSNFEPSVSPDLEAIIMSTLAKDPGDRPQSMGALANALSTMDTGAVQKARANTGREDIGRDSSAQAAQGSSSSSRGMAKTRVATSSPAVAAVSQTTLGGAAGESSPGAWRPPSSSRGPAKIAILVGGIIAATAAAIFVLSTGSDGKTSKPVAAPVESDSQKPSKEVEPAKVEPVESKNITVDIETDPKGASVYNALTGVNLGKTPFREQRPKRRGALELMLKLADYESKIISVPLQEDFSDNFALVTIENVKTVENVKQATKKERKSGKKPGNGKPSTADVKAQAAEKRILEANARKKTADKKAADKKAADKKAADKKAADKKAAEAKKAATKAKKTDSKWGDLEPPPS